MLTLFRKIYMHNILFSNVGGVLPINVTFFYLFTQAFKRFIN